ncbi:hypothetical protein P5F77_12405 [Caldifermentibacillus hisashii]|uniref:hypothetical protein n=1 Tax=Bacillaceae TaxID=186817 RepID=UPI00203C4F17|nr:hypothetical protein [Caldibacillus thermoamylovorans]MCM3797930.1 hypothetical protein [Caldibacillus thermoamylovorans]
MNYIWVERTANTYSDCLKAYGMAYLLGILVRQNNIGTILLKQTPSHFLIEIPDDLYHNWENIVETFEATYIMPLINNTAEEGISGGSTFFLKVEKEKRDVYQTYLLEGQSKRIGEEPPKEHADYHIYSLYQGMKVLTAHNKMAEAFQQDPELIKVVYRWIFQTGTSPLIDTDEKIKTFKNIVKEYEKNSGEKVPLKATVNALSFFNPVQAKGVNNQGATGISPSGVQSFVLDELFKMLGVTQGSVGKLVKVGTNSYDCLLLVIDPQEVASNDVLTIVHNIKGKIKAPSRTYLEFSTLMYTITEVIRFLLRRKEGIPPNLIDYVRGLYCAYFKDLGQAKSVMNLSYYHLPAWMRFENEEDLRQYDRLFTDIIDKVDKIRRDENILQDLDQPLNELVTFISTGQLESFLNFVQAYHFKVFNALYEKNYKLKLKPFSEKILQEVIMKSNQPYSKIVEDTGFINLSRAIFQATLGLQYQDKSIRKYPVHYDLQHKLKQNAPYKEKFITTLADFVATFNSENARVAESNKARGEDSRTRKNISDQDLASVIHLVDEFGSNLVGNLLVAFGYAKKEKDSENQSSESEEKNSKLTVEL